MPSIYKTVSLNVRALRVKAGLTQEQLAEHADTTLRYISEIENNDTNLTLELLDKVARGLGVTPSVLISDGSVAGTLHVPSEEMVPGLRYAMNQLRSALSMAEGMSGAGAKVLFQPTEKAELPSAKKSKVRRKRIPAKK